MKIGVTIQPYEGISAANLVTFVKTIELDHVEVNVHIMPGVNEFVSNLGKLTTTYHLPIFGTEGYDPGSKNKENAEKMKEVIDFINEYSKQMNMIYTLSHPPESPDSNIELLLERLQQIDTPIVLENIPWQKDEEFLEFYTKAKDALGKHLAGHAIDAPHRFLTYGEENWLNVPEILKKDIVYCHFQDTTMEDDDHLPIGQGIMPYRKFLLFLKGIGYTGVINQEIKPKGLDLEAIMDSCLKCVEPFSTARYLKLKAKYAVLKPILRQKIKKAQKEANQ